MSTIDRAMADAALRRCILFRRVQPADLEQCTAELAHRHYRRGETIFHAGDPGDALHVVASGSVKVELPSPQGDEPAILARIDAGGYFGELALLDGEPRSATVVALEPTETLVLDRARFERLLADLPSLRSCLLASLAGELRRLTGHVEAMLFLDLAGRLATRIVALAEADPAVADVRTDVRLPWPYTQAEVASMIGGSRESVNRLLGELTGRGLLHLDRDHLVIPDLDLLAAEAVSVTDPGAGDRGDLAERTRAALEGVALRAAVAGRLEPVAGETILSAVLDTAVTLFDAQAASLALHDPQTDKLVFRVVAGTAGTGALGLEIRADEGIAGYVFRTGQPLAVADVAADPRFGRAAAEASGYLPRSILAVPLIDDDGAIGVLEAIDKRDGTTFGLRDLDLASVLARQATIAIRATRVERDAATLLRTALSRIADGEDADAALAAGLAAVAGDGDDDDGFWSLVDVLARVRRTSPEQLGLVTELVEVLARRSAGRGHGSHR